MNPIDTWRFHVSYQPWMSDSLYFYIQGRVDKERYSSKLILEKHTEGESVEPTLRMLPEEAQQLMDALWDAGVRPRAGQGSAGQLAAVKDHLADMQKLVFSLFT